MCHPLKGRGKRVAVHLRTGTSRMMISWIREGTLDFAVALVSKHTDTADLSITPLYPSDPVIVCRRGHPQAGATSIAVRERAVEQNVCLLQRAAIPVTPAAQEPQR
jgi:DNA-binding transcriptional LysR family regulator